MKKVFEIESDEDGDLNADKIGNALYLKCREVSPNSHAENLAIAGLTEQRKMAITGIAASEDYPYTRSELARQVLGIDAQILKILSK